MENILSSKNAQKGNTPTSTQNCTVDNRHNECIRMANRGTHRLLLDGHLFKVVQDFKDTAGTPCLGRTAVRTELHSIHTKTQS